MSSPFDLWFYDSESVLGRLNMASAGLVMVDRTADHSNGLPRTRKNGLCY